MEVIASRKNPLVGLMRRVAEGDPDRVLLDGLHLLEESRTAQLPVSVAAFTARALATADGRARRLATQLAGTGVRVVQVSDAVMAALSPARAPSGVVALAARPRRAWADVLVPPPALVLVTIDVQDPGNLGAIARVAEAGGATGLVVCGATTDPYGWKALRGSMGSLLRLPVVREPAIDSTLAALASAGLTIVATTREGNVAFDRHDWRSPTAVLLGSEGLGLPAEVLARAHARVTIPMRPPVESLNVAVSAALLVYEARRSRQAGG
jgi:TrmH family RNA methyltransferase